MKKEKNDITWLDKIRIGHVHYILEDPKEILNIVGHNGKILDIAEVAIIGNYDYIFEDLKKSMNEDKKRDPTNYEYHNLYAFILDALMTYIFIILSNKKNCDNKNNYEGFINMFDETKFIYEREKEILDNVFYKYANIEPDEVKDITKMISDTKPELPLKDYPQNITEKEKKLLNYLAENFFIDRELVNNKFKINISRGARIMVLALYEFDPDLNQDYLANFINIYIEHGVEFSTIQNYCRERKKDIPIKNKQNV